QMIREDLIAERVVIEVYQDMIRHFGSDDPTTRVMMEKILHDEEEHASDLADLLYIADPTTGETQGKDPGADPLRIDSRSGDGSQRENRQNAQRFSLRILPIFALVTAVSAKIGKMRSEKRCREKDTTSSRRRRIVLPLPTS